MMLRRKQQQRRGSTLLESALVYPVLFLIVLGIIFLGIAVFRYQQVSHISREASRWAVVHGALYKQEQGRPSLTTASDVYTNSIQPQAASMQLSGLTYSVDWNAVGNSADDDQRRSRSITASGVVVSRANTVTVTVTYTWNTGLFGTIPVSSSSTMPMSY
jgi:Flp pilus assembly protein TadG